MTNYRFDKIKEKEVLRILIKDTTYVLKYIKLGYIFRKKKLSKESLYTKILYIDVIYKLEELLEELNNIYNLIDNTTVENLLNNK